MEHFQGHRGLFRPLARPSIALGTFDGVHVGHRELLNRAKRSADKHDGDMVAYTFSPHPAAFLAKDKAPPLITSESRRLELLADSGASVTIVEPFNREFAAISAESFFQDIVVKILNAKFVVVGDDFTFGKGGKGKASDLLEMAAKAGIACDVVAPVLVDSVRASSTFIRNAVLDGEMQQARVMLGRHFDMDGLVVHGEHRGRELGFPTANIQPPATQNKTLMPAKGIYAVRGRCLESSTTEWLHGAASYGMNPTFSVDEPRLEVHFMDFDGDLYGRQMRIEFIEKLRNEEKYDSIPALVDQMHLDIANAKASIAKQT